MVERCKPGYLLLALMLMLPGGQAVAQQQELQRLFTTAEQRAEIDRQRHEAAVAQSRTGDENSGMLIEKPNIHFKGMAIRDNGEKLLWLNGGVRSLPEWQARLAELLLDALRAEQGVLQVYSDGRWFNLRPNQVLDRAKLTVVEAHQLKPAPELDERATLKAPDEATDAAPQTDNSTGKSAGQMLREIRAIQQQAAGVTGQ